MKRAWLIGGAAVLALSSTLALASPESLLPPGFDNPTPEPTRRPASPAPVPTVVPPAPAEGANGFPADGPPPQILYPPTAPGQVELPAGFPSIEEIEQMTPDQIDDLLGIKPKFDIPAAARRALFRVGVIALGEGGFPSQSLAGQPAGLVRAALAGTKGPLVSRWGHILLRRALASRLDAPVGMNAVEFAALRAGLLNRLGEPVVARALVQDVDSSNYDAGLAGAALDAYVGTGDITGICPVMRLHGDLRKDPEWKLAGSICTAFSGNAQQAARELNGALGAKQSPRIDVLLAQRYAGAAGEGERSVTIEWDEVQQLDPWTYALAVALGMEVPQRLVAGAAPYYRRVASLSPALGLPDRARAADLAGAEGILSGSAMVDLYSQIYADTTIDGAEADRADELREAYVAETPADRIAAIKAVWGSTTPDYGRLVLTAYAAARIAPSKDLAGDAGDLIASMLTAGLDANALRWSDIVEQGSQGWALLALAQPNRASPVPSDAVSSYVDADQSSGQRKSRFLLAGLAGLGRLDDGAIASLSSKLGINLARDSAWSRKLDQAVEVGNPTLVALLVGLGMQGNDWSKMTARQLFLIVRALDRVGLKAEARMIAAEAVARA